jgi:hypothetical protein
MVNLSFWNFCLTLFIVIWIFATCFCFLIKVEKELLSTDEITFIHTFCLFNSLVFICFFLSDGIRTVLLNRQPVFLLLFFCVVFVFDSLIVTLYYRQFFNISYFLLFLKVIVIFVLCFVASEILKGITLLPCSEPYFYKNYLIQWHSLNWDVYFFTFQEVDFFLEHYKNVYIKKHYQVCFDYSVVEGCETQHDLQEYLDSCKRVFKATVGSKKGWLPWWKV